MSCGSGSGQRFAHPRVHQLLSERVSRRGRNVLLVGGRRALGQRLGGWFLCLLLRAGGQGRDLRGRRRRQRPGVFVSYEFLQLLEKSEVGIVRSGERSMRVLTCILLYSMFSDLYFGFVSGG
jgi:hypothetical protein